MNEIKGTLLHYRKPLLILCIAVLVVCGFLYKSITGLIHNKREQKRLAKVSMQLDKEYEQLQEKLELLKNQDPVYIEQIARVKYHMSLPGETEYRFKTK